MNSRIQLLLVEDDDVDIEAVQRTLKGATSYIALATAKNGLEALQWLRSSVHNRSVPPSLILLDLNMPMMNGISFLHALRADPELKGTIVFVLTSSNLEADKLAAYEYNVAGYMLKSELSRNHTRLIDLLDVYRNVVEFPPGRSLL